jgi:hypothetical protein
MAIAASGAKWTGPRRQVDRPAAQVDRPVATRPPARSSFVFRCFCAADLLSLG